MHMARARRNRITSHHITSRERDTIIAEIPCCTGKGKKETTRNMPKLVIDPHRGPSLDQ